MMHTILVLTLNDLAVALKNKSIVLLVFIPLLIFFTLKIADHENATFPKSNIGLIRSQSYPPLMLTALASADLAFKLEWLGSIEEAHRKLKEKSLDGILFVNEADPRRLDLQVARKNSLQTIAMLEGLSGVQAAAEKNGPSWIAGIHSLETGGIQQQTLPTWILTVALLVSLIIIPTQISEEKERKLLLGLLQTPMREAEWLLSKLLMGTILIFISVLLLHFLSAFGCKNWPSYVAMLLAGSFCFCNVGILLGLLCQTQASARTLGLVVYLPNLLPSALAEFSQKMREASRFVPSYQLYEPIKGILLENQSAMDFKFALGYLACGGLGAATLSFILIKRRWLM